MPVGTPLDLELEDRLIYGLTPQRFGYLVLAGLAAMAIWSQRWLPAPLRMSLCALSLSLGAGLAWGGWRGRPIDLHLYDAGLYVIRNYRLQIHEPSPSPQSPVAAQPRAPADPLPVCCSPGLEAPP